jgi:hypothetical protein
MLKQVSPKATSKYAKYELKHTLRETKQSSMLKASKTCDDPAARSDTMSTTALVRELANYIVRIV